MNGEVLIVDEHTGRMLAGRRYNEGMHQAIEAKEGVEIKNENQTLATITLQNYFRMYEKLVGHDRHGHDRGRRAQLHLQARRRAHPDQPADDPRRRGRPRLPDRGGEVQRGRRRHRRAAQRGQPVLVGTVSVEKSRVPLRAAAPPRRPARGPQRQAARARGGDRRGGGPQGRRHRRDEHGRPRHRHHARRQPRVPGRRRAQGQAGSTPTRRPRSTRRPGTRRWPPRRSRSRPSTTRSSSSAACTSSAPSGTSRGASTTSCVAVPAARVTPASPGSTSRSRTTSCGCSTPRWSDRFMTTAGMEDEVPIESKMVSRSIQSAQSQVEGQNFEIRKNVLKYDDVLNRQRPVIYDERRRVLEGEDMEEQIRLFVNDVIEGYVDSATAEGYRRGLGPRAALDRAARSTPCRSPSTSWPTRPPAAATQSPPSGSRRSSSPTRTTRTTARGGSRRRGHARGRAARHAVGAGPQVA